MPRNNPTIDELLERRLREMCDGFCEAIRREVERRRRERLPIHVAVDGRIVDLQQLSEPGTA